MLIASNQFSCTKQDETEIISLSQVGEEVDVRVCLNVMKIFRKPCKKNKQQNFRMVKSLNRGLVSSLLRCGGGLISEVRWSTWDRQITLHSHRAHTSENCLRAFVVH